MEDRPRGCYEERSWIYIHVRKKHCGFCFFSCRPSLRWLLSLYWKTASVSQFSELLLREPQNPSQHISFYLFCFADQCMIHECFYARKQLIARKNTSLACRQLPACSFSQISKDLGDARSVYAKSVLQKPPHAIILLLSLNSMDRQSRLLSTGWQL